jgi:CHAD domain-containing protein
MASAFAFQIGERVDAETRRLARDGAARVLAAIEGAAHEKQSERLVHDARRTLKRLRALLRLVSADRSATHLLRDAARPLGSARDAAVMSRTFDAIAGDDASASRVRTALAKRRKAAKHEDDGRTEASASVRAFIESIDQWELGAGWDGIEPGLRRAYRDGRRALRRAREHDDAEALHTLRKRCKDLQYQLGLLRDVWSPVVGAYGDAARDLGQLLGDDHDLVVLRDELARRTADQQPWLDRIDDKRRALRAKIFPLAECIYVDSTSTFVERFETWWRASVAP